MRTTEPTPSSMETRIAGVLRTGVVLGATLLAAGMPWIVFRHPLPGRPGPSVGEALRDLPSVHPETLAALGVAVLVATPILQLITSAVLFWRRRDRLFLALTLVVCAIVGVGATVVGGGG